MSWTRIGTAVTAIAALLSVPLAVLTVWLLLTCPISVAGAIDQGTLAPLARQLAAVLLQAVRGLMTYL